MNENIITIKLNRPYHVIKMMLLTIERSFIRLTLRRKHNTEFLVVRTWELKLCQFYSDITDTIRVSCLLLTALELIEK